jgi:hypothetical protein
MNLKPGAQYQRKFPPHKRFTIAEVDSYGSNIRVAWEDGQMSYLTPEVIDDTCDEVGGPPVEEENTEPEVTPEEDAEAIASMPQFRRRGTPAIEYHANGNGQTQTAEPAAPHCERCAGPEPDWNVHPEMKPGAVGWRRNQILASLEGLSIAQALEVLADVRTAIFEQKITRR